MKFRHEYKFMINPSEFVMLKNRLGVLLEQDSYTDENGEYRVRSLYFDNLYDKVLREKINSVNYREKFRIRYYNDDFSFIRLEKKTKLNGKCNKVSAPITKEECEKILNNDLFWMLESQYDLIKELYVKMTLQQLRPKVIVEYIRTPFIYDMGNVRVTLDRDIRTSLNSVDLFDLDVPMIVAGNHEILVEVKYDEYCPNIIKDLVGVGRKETAFSKYSQCRLFG